MRLVLILILSLYVGNVFADESCLIIKSDNKDINEGICGQRYSPCSSFKLPLAMMGFEEGVLIDDATPEYPYNNNDENDFDFWQRTHNPKSWLEYSVVWYSQIITSILGVKKFQDYLNKFDYGNKDLSGDFGKNNGLTNSWLTSSLEISPDEQMKFLDKFLSGKLPLKNSTIENVKKIAFIKEFKNGDKLFGKTGSCNQLSADRKTKTNKKIGWFIGWVEHKNDASFLMPSSYSKFVRFEKQSEEAKEYLGPKLKAEILLYFTENIDQ